MDWELGQLLLVCDGEKLCALDFAGYESRMHQFLKKRYGAIQWIEADAQADDLFMVSVRDRLQAYLSGEFASLDALPLNPGGTPFQQQVWFALRSIPPGTVITYGELAKQIGKPTASRAVGMANSLNPIAIVLPCHRVVGANGSLTGYAGGLQRKRWLLHHEGVSLPTIQQQELALGID